MALVTHRLDRCAVDSFQRLNRWFWLAAVLMIATASCQRANAETIAATPTVETVPLSDSQFDVWRSTTTLGGGYSYGDSPSTACQADPGKTWCLTTGGYTFGFGSVQNQTSTTANCKYLFNGSGGGGNCLSVVKQPSACSSGWTLSGSNCTRTVYSCPSTGGWTLSGTSCTRPDCGPGQTPDNNGQCQCPPAGTPIAGNVYGAPGKIDTMTFCAGTCEIAASGRAQGQTQSSWYTEWYGPFTTTGNKDCVQATGQGGPQDAPRCPADQCMGTVNGSQICVPCDQRNRDLPPTTSDTTQQNPGQPTTSVTESTTTSTNCLPTGCTTTTTTTTTEQDFDAVGNPSGPPRTTTTTTQEPGDGSELGEFCEKNPSSPMCVKSAFGGSCSGFTCDGDAVQCAIAREQHVRNCELLTDTGSFSRADAVTAFNSNIATFEKSTLTTSEAVSSISGQTLYASALVDQSWSIRGQTFTIPFSSLVQYLNYAGIAFMIVCGLISARIFSTVA